jgi:tetratricopeptide (TPR) repeat protein
MNIPEVATQYLNERNQLLEEGKLEEAIAIFRRELELNPDISWSHHNLGQALAKLGQFEEAIAAFRRAIELNPDFSWSYHHLGDILDRQQQWEEAVVGFRRAIELNPEHFGSYGGLGHSLVKLGCLDEAIAAYRRASELEPAADWIQYRLGEVLQQRVQVDIEGAIASYRRAIELNPNDVQAYRKLLQIQPDNWEIWLQLGKTLVKLEQWEDASISYRKAIELHPDEALIYYQLGEVLEKQEYQEEAISYYRRALELDPSFISDDNSPAIALAKLRQLVQFPPQEELFLQTTNHLNDADFVQAAFCTYLKRSLDDQGIAAYLEFTRSMERLQIVKSIRNSQEFYLRWQLYLSATSVEEVYWHIGTFFAQQSLWEEAIAAYHHVISFKPNIAMSYSRWEENLALENKTDPQVAFRAKFFKSLLKQPESAEIYAYLGELLVAHNKVNDAIQVYQKSLSFPQESTVSSELYFNLGQALAQQNRLDEAIRYFEELLKSNKDSVYFLIKIGHILQQHNRLDEALDCYHKALKLEPPNQSEIYIHIADILSIQKQQYLAIHYYHEAIGMQPNQGDAYIRIGHILSQENQLEEATKYYRKAIKIPQVHYHAYISLVNCLVQQEKLDESVLCLQELIINQNYPWWITSEALNHLENIFQKQGKLEEAKEANVCLQKLQPRSSPNGFYATTKEWAVASNLDHTKYVDIHPVHRIEIPLPKTIDKEVHPSLIHWSNFDSPPTFVATLQEGRYCELDGRTTCYITDDNQLLLDVSSFINPGNLSELNFPPIHHVEGTLAVLSGNTSIIYYHWIVDALPKLGLMELSNINLDSIDKFLVSSYSGFHKETLDILGIPEHKIIESSKYPHVQAEKMIVSSYPGIVCCPTKWATDFLRNKFLPAAAKSKLEQPERIYISRKMVGNRRIINEDEVVEVLNQLGFVTITAESISISEKISLMSSAKVILTQHSGGGTNLLFCRPGTKVIEIFTPHNVGSCYYILSAYIGLDYYYLIGEGIKCAYLRQLIYNIDGFEDTFINIDALKALLKMAGVT